MNPRKAGQRVGRTLRRTGALSAAALLCLSAAPASAGEVEASTTTLMWTRPAWRAGESEQDTSLIQKVGISAHTADVPYVDDLQFQLAGWGRLWLGPSDEDTGAGDLEVGWIRARALDRRVTLTVGRQMVVGGAARFLHLDGGQADVTFYKGVGLQAYGGLQVIPRFAAVTGDAVVGGRAYWRPSFQNELGVSAIQVLDDGLIARRDLGVDGRWGLMRNLDLKASGVWSIPESRVADAQVAVWWTARPELQVGADVRRTAPDLYISRSSIFSVFAEHERDAVGAMASWDVLPRLTLTGDYHFLDMDEGTGHDAVARADWRLTRNTLVGGQARVLSEPWNGYADLRFFGRHAITHELAVSAELQGTQLFEDVNGHRQSLNAGATVSYSIAPGWAAHVTGYAGTSPFFTSRYEVIGRLSYDGSQARRAQ